MNTIDEINKEFPIGKTLKYILLLGLGLVLIGIPMGWFGQAAEVAKDEFGPKAALEKYEWFIDQAKNIEKMSQDVVLFEERASQVETKFSSYGKKTEWTLDVRMLYNEEIKQAQNDVLAVKSQRNGLVREYNAASSKFNWSAFQTEPDKPKEEFFELK